MLAVFGFIYWVLSNSAEHMTGGTLTQLFANDMQDINLTGGKMGSTDQLATGNFLLYWNHPTRIASGRGYGNGVPNRGQLLSTIPQVSVNPSPFSTANSQKSSTSKSNVNVGGLLNSDDNTEFLRINPKSTISSYPGIKNILINQKENNDMIDRELSKEMFKDQLINNSKLSHKNNNTLRTGSMNTLQNALVNSCQTCGQGKCTNCPICMNRQISNSIIEPESDSIATNKVDAKSIGRLVDDSETEYQSEYQSVENFNSEKLNKKPIESNKKPIESNKKPIESNKKIIKKHENYKNHENFNSEKLNKKPIESHKKPIESHKKIIKKHENFKNYENFNSEKLNKKPIQIHKKLIKYNGNHENFNDDNDDNDDDNDDNDDNDDDNDYDDDDNNDNSLTNLNNQLRLNTGTCANCPQARCINCPMQQNECSDENCALGYPCNTCKTLSFLNDRDQIVDSDNIKENFIASKIKNLNSNNSKNSKNSNNSNNSNNSKKLKLENFDCPCKKKFSMGNNFNSKYINDDEGFTSMNSSNAKNMENFQCSLNPDSTECIGCTNQCPCRLGNCANCSTCKSGKAPCPSCPNNRCPCLMGRCKDCPACKSGHCPMCNNNKIEAINKIEANNNENFSTIGFDSLCPCSRTHCTNCSECRMGKCPTCPRSNKFDNQLDNQLSNQSTYIDLASFGDWEGGSRLGTNWNNATNGPSPVNITEDLVFYPDSYVGSYFINPNPDIAYPYAVIPPSRTVGGLVVNN